MSWWEWWCFAMNAFTLFYAIGQFLVWLDRRQR